MSISESYNSWADSYDTNKNRTRDLDKIATRQMLNEYLFDTILETGCGTGKNTEWFIQRAKSVMALDFSEKMLEKARQKILSDRVEFRQADLTRPWALGEAITDLVSFNLVLEHIEDLSFVFQQAVLALRPGGKLFVCELHPFKQYAGSKARFEGDDGLVKELEVFVHHFTDYVEAAKENGFRMLKVQEWFDNDDKTEIPRLLAFVFEKV